MATWLKSLETVMEGIDSAAANLKNKEKSTLPTLNTEGNQNSGTTMEHLNLLPPPSTEDVGGSQLNSTFFPEKQSTNQGPTSVYSSNSSISSPLRPNPSLKPSSVVGNSVEDDRLFEFLNNGDINAPLSTIHTSVFSPI